MTTEPKYGVAVEDGAWVCGCDIRYRATRGQCGDCAYLNPSLEREAQVKDIGSNIPEKKVGTRVSQVDITPEADARQRATLIREHIERMADEARYAGTLLAVAETAEDWKHLGYASWTAYLEGEYAESRRHLYRILNTYKQSFALSERIGEDVQLSHRQAQTMQQHPEAIDQVAQQVSEGAEPQEAIKEVVSGFTEKGLPRQHDPKVTDPNKEYEAAKAAQPEEAKAPPTTTYRDKTPTTIDAVKEWQPPEWVQNTVAKLEQHNPRVDYSAQVEKIEMYCNTLGVSVESIARGFRDYWTLHYREHKSWERAAPMNILARPSVIEAQASKQGLIKSTNKHCPTCTCNGDSDNDDFSQSLRDIEAAQREYRKQQETDVEPDTAL